MSKINMVETTFVEFKFFAKNQIIQDLVEKD